MDFQSFVFSYDYTDFLTLMQFNFETLQCLTTQNGYTFVTRLNVNAFCTIL